MDEERRRISLGMKSSYFCDNTDNLKPSDQRSDDAFGDNHILADSQMTLPPSNSPMLQNVDIRSENGKHPIIAQVESRASILPLEVTLDDVEDSPVNNAVGQSLENIDNTDTIDEKNNRRAKKKAKEERYGYHQHSSISFSPDIIVFSDL